MDREKEWAQVTATMDQVMASLRENAMAMSDLLEVVDAMMDPVDTGDGDVYVVSESVWGIVRGLAQMALAIGLYQNNKGRRDGV